MTPNGQAMASYGKQRQWCRISGYPGYHCSLPRVGQELSKSRICLLEAHAQDATASDAILHRELNENIV
jgi:hypothetical protein